MLRTQFVSVALSSWWWLCSIGLYSRLLGLSCLMPYLTANAGSSKSHAFFSLFNFRLLEEFKAGWISLLHGNDRSIVCFPTLSRIGMPSVMTTVKVRLSSGAIYCIGSGRVNFPITALIALCFVVVARKVLIIHQSFGYC